MEDHCGQHPGSGAALKDELTSLRLYNTLEFLWPQTVWEHLNEVFAFRRLATSIGSELVIPDLHADTIRIESPSPVQTFFSGLVYLYDVLTATTIRRTVSHQCN